MITSTRVAASSPQPRFPRSQVIASLTPPAPPAAMGLLEAALRRVFGLVRLAAATAGGLAGLGFTLVVVFQARCPPAHSACRCR
jgi:hypothetical protein